jgi:hypothetical protein
MARLAEMKKLKNITGNYLFEAINNSALRRREEGTGQSTLTDAVRLYAALNTGEDFVLEVCLCASVEGMFIQAKASSFDSLRCLLGDYLFEAVKASKKRRDEEEQGMMKSTCAVDMSVPSAGGRGADGQLKIMLNFEVGWRILREMYPVYGLGTSLNSVSMTSTL